MAAAFQLFQLEKASGRSDLLDLPHRPVNVIDALDCQYGRTITELSDRFEISQRTVYRYLDTFKQVGFVIENTNGYFKIDKENTTVQEISHLLHFSEEEAFILSKAIHSIEDTDELKSKLVKKLYSLYNFDRVIHAISKKEESEKWKVERYVYQVYLEFLMQSCL